MKKIVIFLCFVFILTSTSVFAAKYKVNTKGTVKKDGKVVKPVNTSSVKQYSVSNASNYILNNQVNSVPVPTIEIVMDYSGSMSNCIQEAKRAMSSIIHQIPSATNVGFRVFGQNSFGTNPNTSKVLGEVKKIVKKKGKYNVVTKSSPVGTISGYCSSTTQVTSIMKANTNAILNGMNSVDIGGATPMVYALDRAIYQDLASRSYDEPKKIVLITDGGENCGGDPCAYAQQLMKKRSDIYVDVVLVSKWSDSKLACLANVTRGKLYKVNDVSEFSSVVVQSMTTPPQASTQQTQQYEYYKY